jgi:hypothetical protein
MSTKKAAEAAFLGYFWLQGISYPVEVTPLGALLQNMHHLHLWFYADYVSRLSCRSYQYLLPRRNCVWPIINTHIERTLVYLLWHTQPVYDYTALRFFPDPGFSVCVYGGPFGYCPRVRNNFLSRH